MKADVCVIGAGPVGASLALALAGRNLRVLLQAPPGLPRQTDVRTYALNAGSVALLGELRVWEAMPPDAVTPVLDMQVHGDAGDDVRFSAWRQRVDALAWIVDAAALDEALATALRFAPHVAVSDDTAPTDAPLTAVCEGRHSAARTRLGVDFESSPYGQQALAVRVVASAPHRGLARQWFRSPDVLALLPFDRPEAGSSYGVVWSLPDARAAELLAAGAQALEAALNEATGHAAGSLRVASPPVSWPLTLGRAARLHGRGWVLLGDSAHVVHPLAGQGLNLGLADVAALARMVADREPWRSVGDEKLLARYARERSGPTDAMAGLTDGLLRLFAHPAPMVKELRNRGLTLVDHLPSVKRWLAGRALGT